MRYHPWGMGEISLLGMGGISPFGNGWDINLGGMGEISTLGGMGGTSP